MSGKCMASLLVAAWLFCWLAGGVSADNWPTYRHDIRRSGASDEQMKPPLSEQWAFTAVHPPSHAWADPQPKPVEEVLELPRLRFDDAFHVAAVGNSVYFGSSSDNKVYALDAKTGQIRWEFYTDGPVRLAPTVWQDKIYVGSDDGRVYCLDARNGRAVWSFSAAPSRQKVLGNGKMISLWPVRTGVLIDDGVAYFGAGVFPAEGLYLYGLDAKDGRLLWTNDTYGRGGAGTVSPQGYLLASEDKLFVPSARCMPAAFSRQDGRFLFQRNLDWRQSGLFGGTYCVLAGDLLLNGTEQLLAIDSRDGMLALAEGLTPDFHSKAARRAAFGDGVLYLFTDDRLAAVNFSDWVTHRALLWRLARRAARFTSRLEALKARDSLDEASAKRLADLQRRLDDEAAEKQGLQEQIAKQTVWQVPCHGADSIALARGMLFVGGRDVVRGLELAGGREVWSAKVSGRARGLAIARGRLLVSTDRGSIHCFWQGSRAWSRKVTHQPTVDPFAKDRLAGFYAKTADAIVSEGGVDRGYALILGGDQGQLALELAKRTDLMIHMVQPDAGKAAAARKALSAAGVYGKKVVVQRGPLTKLPYPDYFANLILCEASFLAGSSSIATPAREVLRMLKPCGGVAFIGQSPAAGEHGAKQASVSPWLTELRSALGDLGEAETRISRKAAWAKVTRGPLNGAGSWTHQYAEPGNTACSDDRLVRGPIGMLWFGRPGPERMPSRHDSNVAPLAVGGRMFVQGENVVMAYDAYNGLLLWERENAAALRVGLKTGCGNLAANDDSLFVAIHDVCLRLDQATGKMLTVYYRPPAARKSNNEQWTYVACSGGLLYGSSGDCVFAVDVKSGEQKWVHKGKNVSSATICIGGGKLFLVDRSATEAQQAEALAGITHEMRLDRRGEPIQPDVRLVVALDAETGQQEWARGQYVSDCVGVSRAGGELTTMYANDVLLLCGQPWNGHFWREFLAGEFSRRSLIALSAADGQTLWSGRMGYRSRPLIVGNEIIAEPWAYDLSTGAEKMRAHPITGAEAKWQMSRPGHHCGNIAAGPNVLLFRSGSTAYYDLIGDYGTAHFGAQRPGCWINTIPANGVVMMPEASSGCVCPFALHCTIVFAPRKTNRVWGVFSAPGPTTPVKNLAVNLGAPGDRKDTSGKLWLAYPRPRTGRLVLDLHLDLLDGEVLRRNPNFLKIGGTNEPWIYAFGQTDMTPLAIPVSEGRTEAEKYALRLHFAETEHDQPGQRVFDVAVQGQTVLKDFDIVAEAGGPYRAVVKEFKGVKAAGEVVITFAAIKAEPLLCGVEVVLEPLTE